MQLGVCTTIDQSGVAKAAGWDFVEIRVDQFIEGLLPDAQWKGAEVAAGSQLPVLAGNVLVPPVLKITGPDVDLGGLKKYLMTVLRRSAGVGIKTLVFGSGGARNVPDGFDRNVARGQIIDLLKLIAPIAQSHGITIVIEHLNHKECNIINSIEEAMTYVNELNHPNVRCLADSFHFWLNKESIESLKSAVHAIKHVHVADRQNRSAPGTSGKDDYKPFFGALKLVGYNGPVCVEAVDFDLAARGLAVRDYVKDQWERS